MHTPHLKQFLSIDGVQGASVQIGMEIFKSGLTLLQNAIKAYACDHPRQNS
jgi:hypothetical protein